MAMDGSYLEHLISGTPSRCASDCWSFAKRMVATGPFPTYVRIADWSPAILDRYQEAGFEDVCIFARNPYPTGVSDVWPQGSLERSRQTLREVAAEIDPRGRNQLESAHRFVLVLDPREASMVTSTCLRFPNSALADLHIQSTWSPAQASLYSRAALSCSSFRRIGSGRSPNCWLTYSFGARAMLAGPGDMLVG